MHSILNNKFTRGAALVDTIAASVQPSHDEHAVQPQRRPQAAADEEVRLRRRGHAWGHAVVRVVACVEINQ